MSESDRKIPKASGFQGLSRKSGDRVLATRLLPTFSSNQLQILVGRALLEADKHRATALDGDVPVSTHSIYMHHMHAAALQTEVIMRAIFTR